VFYSWVVNALQSLDPTRHFCETGCLKIKAKKLVNIKT